MTFPCPCRLKGCTHSVFHHLHRQGRPCSGRHPMPVAGPEPYAFQVAKTVQRGVLRTQDIERQTSRPHADVDAAAWPGRVQLPQRSSHHLSPPHGPWARTQREDWMRCLFPQQLYSMKSMCSASPLVSTQETLRRLPQSAHNLEEDTADRTSNIQQSAISSSQQHPAVTNIQQPARVSNQQHVGQGA